MCEARLCDSLSELRGEHIAAVPSILLSCRRGISVADRGCEGAWAKEVEGESSVAVARLDSGAKSGERGTEARPEALLASADVLMLRLTLVSSNMVREKNHTIGEFRQSG